MWSMWLLIPVRHCPCLIEHSQNSGMVYPYMNNRPWTTAPLMRCIVQSLGSKKQRNSLACLGYSWRLCYGLWVCPSLSDIAHASYNTHKRVDSISIHDVSWPLDNYITTEVHGSSSWFQNSVYSSITAEHILGCDVVYRIALPCQTPSIPHITLTEQWDSIYIHVPCPLDHYTTDEVHGLSLCF